jgi:hypothetical protein
VKKRKVWEFSTPNRHLAGREREHDSATDGCGRSLPRAIGLVWTMAFFNAPSFCSSTLTSLALSVSAAFSSILALI